MLRFAWDKRKVLAMVAIVALGFGLGYSLTAHLIQGSGISEPRAPRDTPRASRLAPGADFRVEPRTRVTYRSHYSECGHSVMEIGIAPPEIIGLTREDLEAMDWEWQVQGLGPGYLHLTRLLEGLCPEDQEYRWIGIVDGYVTVFYGKPRPDPHLKERTRIQAASLYEDDRKRLESGVWVKGDQGVREVLEGLTD